MFFTVSPGWNVSMPDAATKSLPACLGQKIKTPAA
jgi:hypothetical protein